MKNNYDNSNIKDWLTVEIIDKQEIDTKANFEQHFGKEKNGFCDWALDGVKFLIQGTGYFRDYEDINDSQNFENLYKSYTYLCIYQNAFTFKASYNLLLTGFISESAVLLRRIIEIFIRLLYIGKRKNIENIFQVLSGYEGYKGKKFIVRYKTQFDEIAPGLYKQYQILCNVVHGSMSAYVFNIKEIDKIMYMKPGIEFDAENSYFIVNQFSVLLLAHIEYMLKIFPEITLRVSQLNCEEFVKTRKYLWKFIEEISNSEKHNDWYESISNLFRAINI